MRRVLLKLSGEALLGSQPFGIDPTACLEIAHALKALKELQQIDLALVIGGGNIGRGVALQKLGVQRTPADQIGMLATLMNGLALRQALEAVGCPAELMTALDCPKVALSYQWNRAMELLQAGKLLIFAGGTGSPYFTTDTAAALRASEIQADMLWKATKVDGIYDKDPMKFDDAEKYSKISYSQVLAEKLEVMDATSVALCRASGTPIFVFNKSLLNPSSLDRTKFSFSQGTLVEGE